MVAGLILVMLGLGSGFGSTCPCPMQPPSQPSSACQCYGSLGAYSIMVFYSGVVAIVGGVATATMDFSGKLFKCTSPT